MGKSLVVVALPSQDDPVRLKSSEKEPHLTLLYLGDPEYDQEKLNRISGYIEHASKHLNPFVLEVMERDVIGDSKADVLLFSKQWNQDIERFRNQLLQQPLVSAAYHATTQFPTWRPHLTLGYPDTPASEPKRVDPSFVEFDRISFWTGEYDGPTFKLKSSNYEEGEEVSMPHADSTGSYWDLDSRLLHYGVKGMKWGVRKSDGGVSRAQSKRVSTTTKDGTSDNISDDTKRVVKSMGKINKSGTASLSNDELRDVINRINLERQYSSLMRPDPNTKSALERGHERVKKTVGLGKTVEEARRFLDTPTGQAVKTGLFGAAAAAAAYTTGGASTAAAAGVGVVVRRASSR